jgi:uncharacterized membrane protein YhhN
MTDAAAAPRHNASTLFFAFAAIVAMSHLANDWIELAQPWGLVWKASGIVLLGLYALSQRAWIAGIALLACATGDVLLEIVFVAGMAAFALGHLLYIACFVQWGRILGLNKRDYPVAGLIVVISAGLMVWFLPGMGELLIPALIYQVIITVMVATAFVVKAPMLARLGAVLFMLSDSLIALGKFTDLSAPAGSVWITYAGAQILMAWGLSRVAPYRDRAKAAQTV